MSIYRSAQGKMVDMAALAAKNEKTRAVGNMKVNARGDIIDRNGNIVQTVNEKINDQYAKTVGNKSAQAQVVRQDRSSASGAQPSNTARRTAPLTSQLTESEQELENSFEDDLEIEQIRSNEDKKRK